jgi:hypothetical protein
MTDEEIAELREHRAIYLSVLENKQFYSLERILNSSELLVEIDEAIAEHEGRRG